MKVGLKKREHGFTLLEMMISIALGAFVLAAATQMYTQGVSATFVTSQRAELQQDFRAASDILTRDLTLAGGGLAQGAAIALPSTTNPIYGCDQSGTCYINGGSVAYPKQSTTAYMYGLLPGYDDGPTLLTAQGATDIVTVVYTDSTFYLNCYTATITSTTTVSFALPGTTSSNCTSPTGNTGAQAVNDAAEGLIAGDLVLFNFNGTNIVAEVTTNAGTSSATFAASDVLKFNQGSTVPNSLAHTYSSTTPVTGYGSRLDVVSYYIDNSPTPPRLMRQVSGHTPQPVAENVVYMKFTYDLFNDATNSPAVNCSNPGASSDGCSTSGASSGLLPNQITKINIQNMAMDSTINSAMFGYANGYQRMDLQTSVCARNLTYVNNYQN
jgi:prepilin-type N-terminal cleavage/methylation domain-containing protein